MVNKKSMNDKSLQIVRVAFPIAIPGFYDYLVPEKFKGRIYEGTPVLVELKTRKMWGVAVALTDRSEHSNLKTVFDIKKIRINESDRELVNVYEWISSYYQCELGTVYKPFIRKGIVRAQPKKITVYAATGKQPDTLTIRQQQALDKIRALDEPMTAGQLKRRLHISEHILRVLYHADTLTKEQQTVLRQADELKMETYTLSAALSEEQQSALDTIKKSIDTPDKPFLLYGITGSGKTHVYIELARAVLARGKGVIILVPEIALTPQTIQRFKSALGDDIAVIHSRMSNGERRDSLESLITGQKRIVIGVRSAIVAPVHDVGCIVVDEEHDGSYKQSESPPRYNARDVAVMRGKMQNAVVILGSATPSLESYYNAQKGKYHLLKLTRRFGHAVLPSVSIVDMNEEHRENNWSFLSRYLHTRIDETLRKGRQVILLLNRRGFSTFLICKDCGHTFSCPNCSVHLTYHRSDTALKCHQCGYEETAPQQCPKCHGEYIKYKGTGIQKAEELIAEQFPHASIQRMDQDTTRRKGAHISILERFGTGAVDILIGTQMVAKGLNFPGVALVGVLQADIGLHFPDFRASEKTFQLLTQVAGRAGRTDNCGEVVIQTYFPEEPSIVAAQTHDFLSFYDAEIGARHQLKYPPVYRLARIVVAGSDEAAVKKTITAAARAIEAGSGREAIHILGPAPAVFSKLHGQYRYSLLVKSPSPRRLSAILSNMRKKMPLRSRNIRMSIDVDPLNML
jgi:primosomal protein N' (replication factor Y)